MKLVEQGLEIAKDQTPLAVPMGMVSKAEILFIAGQPEQAESVIAGAEPGRLPGPVRGPRVRTSTSSEGGLRGMGRPRRSRGDRRCGDRVAPSARARSVPPRGPPAQIEVAHRLRAPGGGGPPTSGGEVPRRRNGLPTPAVGDRLGAEPSRGRSWRRRGCCSPLRAEAAVDRLRDHGDDRRRRAPRASSPSPEGAPRSPSADADAARSGASGSRRR